MAARFGDRRTISRPWPGPQWWAFTAAFAVLSTPFIAFVALRPDAIGGDARVYLEGARRALAGEQPWDAQISGIFFIAPPPTLLPYLPTVPLGPVLGPTFWLAASATSAVWALRRLGLPTSFLLWPPLLVAIAYGSAEPIVLAALLTTWGWVGALIKPYAGVTLIVLGRWREAGVAIGLALGSFPWWVDFLGRLDHVWTVMQGLTFGSLSVASMPALIPAALLLLVLSGRQRAAWLAVPMFLPITQPHYAILALPALGAAGATAISLPIPAAAVWAVAADRLMDIARRDVVRVSDWLGSRP